MNKEILKTLEGQGYVKKRDLPKWHPALNTALSYRGECVVEVALHNGDRMTYDINQIDKKASELKEDIAEITSAMGEKYATAANDNLRSLEGELWRKRRELPYLQEVDKFFIKIVDEKNIIKCYIGDGGGVFASEDNNPYWPHEFKNSSVYLTKPPKEDRKCGGYVVFAVTDHSFYNGKMWLSFRIDFMPKNESPRGKYAIMHAVYRGDKETGQREMSSDEMKPFYGYSDRDYINPYEVAQFNYLCDKVEELTKELFDKFDQIASSQQEESNESKSNNE